MKKDLTYYLKLDYPILVSKYEEDGKIFYETEIPDLPGCGAHGKSRKEALERIEEAKELWIMARLKRGLDVPEPVSADDFSGRYLLRMSPRLHKELTLNAKKEGISLNQYIRSLLEKNVTLEAILEKLNEMEKELRYLRQRIESSTSTYSIEEQSFGGVIAVSQTSTAGVGETVGMDEYSLSYLNNLWEENRWRNK